MIICEASVVRIPTTRSRVDWGFGLVMLSFSPTMRLRSVDFPTFGFPTTVTIPALGILKDSRGIADEKKATRRIERLFNEMPATAYSPAFSRTEYHRRCRS